MQYKSEQSPDESWLTSRREEVATLIEAGWEAAKRGEVIDAEQLRAELRRRKRADRP